MNSVEIGLVHFVRDGVEVRQLSAGSAAVARGRFTNTLSGASLARIRRLIEAASALTEAHPTKFLVESAGAAPDPKGALGALRMLDVEGVIHATAGPGRQLIWNLGPRPAGVDPPERAWLWPTQTLRDLLSFASESWFSTDLIVRECAFDPALPSSLIGAGSPDDAELPVSMFSDASKNARRYALGALKVLYWRELVAWRQYSRQAIDWRWVGEGGRGRRLNDWPGTIVPSGSRGDPYVDDGAMRERAVARAKRALGRRLDFEDRRQAWIDQHHPEAAEEFRFRQEQARARREARRREVKREARRWSESQDTNYASGRGTFR